MMRAAFARVLLYPVDRRHDRDRQPSVRLSLLSRLHANKSLGKRLSNVYQTFIER